MTIRPTFENPRVTANPHNADVKEIKIAINNGREVTEYTFMYKAIAGTTDAKIREQILDTQSVFFKRLASLIELSQAIQETPGLNSEVKQAHLLQKANGKVRLVTPLDSTTAPQVGKKLKDFKSDLEQPNTSPALKQLARKIDDYLLNKMPEFRAHAATGTLTLASQTSTTQQQLQQQQTQQQLQHQQQQTQQQQQQQLQQQQQQQPQQIQQAQQQQLPLQTPIQSPPPLPPRIQQPSQLQQQQQQTQQAQQQQLQPQSQQPQDDAPLPFLPDSNDQLGNIPQIPVSGGSNPFASPQAQPSSLTQPPPATPASSSLLSAIQGNKVFKKIQTQPPGQAPLPSAQHRPPTSGQPPLTSPSPTLGGLSPPSAAPPSLTSPSALSSPLPPSSPPPPLTILSDNERQVLDRIDRDIKNPSDFDTVLSLIINNKIDNIKKPLIRSYLKFIFLDINKIDISKINKNNLQPNNILIIRNWINQNAKDNLITFDEFISRQLPLAPTLAPSSAPPPLTSAPPPTLPPKRQPTKGAPFKQPQIAGTTHTNVQTSDLSPLQPKARSLSTPAEPRSKVSTESSHKEPQPLPASATLSTSPPIGISAPPLSPPPPLTSAPPPSSSPPPADLPPIPQQNDIAKINSIITILKQSSLDNEEQKKNTVLLGQTLSQMTSATEFNNAIQSLANFYTNITDDDQKQPLINALDRRALKQLSTSIPNDKLMDSKLKNIDMELTEITSSEESYIKALQRLMDKKQELKTLLTRYQLSTVEEFDDIFGNNSKPGLLANVIQSYNQKIKPLKTPESINDFINSASFLEHVQSVCALTQKIAPLINQANFAYVSKEDLYSPKGVLNINNQLQSIIINSIQRGPRYELYGKNLLKNPQALGKIKEEILQANSFDQTYTTRVETSFNEKHRLFSATHKEMNKDNTIEFIRSLTNHELAYLLNLEKPQMKINSNVHKVFKGLYVILKESNPQTCVDLINEMLSSKEFNNLDKTQRALLIKCVCPNQASVIKFMGQFNSDEDSVEKFQNNVDLLELLAP